MCNACSLFDCSDVMYLKCTRKQPEKCAKMNIYMIARRREWNFYADNNIVYSSHYSMNYETSIWAFARYFYSTNRRRKRYCLNTCTYTVPGFHKYSISSYVFMHILSVKLCVFFACLSRALVFDLAISFANYTEAERFRQQICPPLF